MNFAVILFVVGLVASTSAAPIDTSKDVANLVINDMAIWLFNGSGCVSSCGAKPGVCPGTEITEQNLRSCVGCVAQCLLPDGVVKCFPGWSQQQLIDNVDGLFEMLFVDGCSLSQVSASCTPMPPVLGDFFYRLTTGALPLPPTPSTGCPPASILPKPPTLTAQQKTDACANMKCTVEKASATPACKRGAVALPIVYTMLAQNWIGCPK